MSHDLARPHDQGVMLLYRQEPIKVRHHLANIGGHRNYDNGNSRFSLSLDQGSRDFIGQSNKLPSFLF